MWAQAAWPRNDLTNGTGKCAGAYSITFFVKMLIACAGVVAFEGMSVHEQISQRV
jgi:hypothetical protein